MAGWYAEGRLSSREDVAVGLENFPDTLLRLFSGENTGSWCSRSRRSKNLVKIVPLGTPGQQVRGLHRYRAHPTRWPAPGAEGSTLNETERPHRPAGHKYLSENPSARVSATAMERSWGFRTVSERRGDCPRHRVGRLWWVRLTQLGAAERRFAGVPAGHLEPQLKAARSCRSMSRRRRKPTPRTRTRRSASWASRPRRFAKSPSLGSAAAITPASCAATRRATARASSPTHRLTRRARDRPRRDRAADPGRSVAAAGRVRSPFSSASILHIRRQPSRPSGTRRRRPPTIRASTRCPAFRPRF